MRSGAARADPDSCPPHNDLNRFTQGRQTEAMTSVGKGINSLLESTEPINHRDLPRQEDTTTAARAFCGLRLPAGQQPKPFIIGMAVHGARTTAVGAASGASFPDQA
jgi:hypothetical protein